MRYYHVIMNILKNCVNHVMMTQRQVDQTLYNQTISLQLMAI